MDFIIICVTDVLKAVGLLLLLIFAAYGITNLYFDIKEYRNERAQMRDWEKGKGS